MKGKNKKQKRRINMQKEKNKIKKVLKKSTTKHRYSFKESEQQKKTNRNLLQKQIENLNKTLAESNIREFAELLGNSKKLLWKNLIAGISRGIGIGIGVTVITAILIILLQKIVTLNIPVIRRIYSRYCGDCAKK